MTLKHKSLDMSIKAVDAEKGTFTAYGNTFDNVDHAGDKTMKGAFSKCIQSCNSKGRMPRLLSQHGHRQNPIGVITSMKEDEHGLLFEGKFCLEPGTAGAEAYALVKMGALDQFSIGYNIVSERKNGNVNELLELDVKEISLVTFACNENSLIQSIKSTIESDGEVTTRMVQKALQDWGLSKRQATSAVDAIKETAEVERKEQSLINKIKAKADSHELDTKSLNFTRDDISLGDFVSLIAESTVESVKGDETYAYVESMFMDYVILSVYDYSGEDVKHSYQKLSYQVSDDAKDVMVGTPVEVTREVKWLTQDELDARTAAGVKELQEVQEEENGEELLIKELADSISSDWFK